MPTPQAAERNAGQASACARAPRALAGVIAPALRCAWLRTAVPCIPRPRRKGKGHRLCHAATSLPARRGPKPPASARPAPGGRWPSLCGVRGSLPHCRAKAGETRCVSLSARMGDPCPALGEAFAARHEVGPCFSRESAWIVRCRTPGKPQLAAAINNAATGLAAWSATSGQIRH